MGYLWEEKVMPRKPKQNPAYRFVTQNPKYKPRKRGGRLFTFDAKTWMYQPFTILGKRGKK